MSIKKSKTAIIAGGGCLVNNYIEIIKKKNINFFVIAIDKYFINDKYKPEFILNFNNIGEIFKILNNEKVKDVVFLGFLKKPSLLYLKPNFITFYYLLLIGFYYFKGDNSLLTRIHNIFKTKGYNVVDSRVILKNNLAKKSFNNLHLFKNQINLTKIKNYLDLTKKFGKRDIGQAVIICNDTIILTENKNGTDDLIKRYKKLSRDNEFSLLVKTTKPNQNFYFDIPTIGPDTIINLHNAKIKGIIIEKNKTFLVNPIKTLNLVNKYKLLYYAI